MWGQLPRQRAASPLSSSAGAGLGAELSLKPLLQPHCPSPAESPRCFPAPPSPARHRAGHHVPATALPTRTITHGVGTCFRAALHFTDPRMRWQQTGTVSQGLGNAPGRAQQRLPVWRESRTQGRAAPLQLVGLLVSEVPPRSSSRGAPQAVPRAPQSWEQALEQTRGRQTASCRGLRGQTDVPGNLHQSLDHSDTDLQAKEMPRQPTPRWRHPASPRTDVGDGKVGDVLPSPGCRSHGNGVEMPVATGDGCCGGNSGSGSG